MADKPKAIHECHEEEFAFLLAALWRCPMGWQAIPFPFRGPGSVGCLGSLIGIWLFSRPPKRLIDELPRFIGSKVVQASPYMGSYGMGGPGFLGLQMETGRGREWIIYRLWGAAEWLTLDRKVVNDGLLPEERKSLPLQRQVSIQSIKENTFKSYRSDHDVLELLFETRNGAARSLVLARNGEDVSAWRGTGEKKTIPVDESLDDVIVVSKKGRLWLI